MKISTKGLYGLRAIMDLAIHSKGELVALKHIAERQEISDAYLEQVFSSLRKAGLVKSQKGSQGGYLLGKAMKDITVGNVLLVLEGELFPYDENANNNLIDQLLIEEVWQAMNRSIAQVVDSLTLEDLVNHYLILEQENDPMFYI
ncbi:MAG: Rrf2 family transcriptional regulator [Firmicutes bacterium HGW-Firmicutes-1]|jgi:Rrf2 family protein|nr:MAG: Rrf2 family transcriptional regulator [Firmicutes bacterium HGW-Firmicutes-1]